MKKGEDEGRLGTVIIGQKETRTEEKDMGWTDLKKGDVTDDQWTEPADGLDCRVAGKWSGPVKSYRNTVWSNGIE